MTEYEWEEWQWRESVNHHFTNYSGKDHTKGLEKLKMFDNYAKDELPNFLDEGLFNDRR